MGKTKKKIISSRQEKFLNLVAESGVFTEHFYFTGGTALSYFYLQHRYSEDLDFFSPQEFDPRDVFSFIQGFRENLGFSQIDYQQSFNRNIFHLIFSPRQSLKIEFTFFPFDQLDTPLVYKKLKIDSLLDIAVNKVFTIAQKPRLRDFFDIYFILHSTSWKLEELVEKARLKFDWYIDWLQFSSNLFSVSQLRDDPLLAPPYATEIFLKKVRGFFEKEAKRLKDKILEE